MMLEIDFGILRQNNPFSTPKAIYTYEGGPVGWIQRGKAWGG